MGPAWFPVLMGLPPFRPAILRTVHFMQVFCFSNLLNIASEQALSTVSILWRDIASRKGLKKLFGAALRPIASREGRVHDHNSTMSGWGL